MHNGPYHLEAHAASDDFFHDFGGARVDGLHTRVDECFCDGVLGHVAVAAEELEAGAHDPLLHLGTPPLGHGRFLDAQFPGVVQQDAVVEEDAGDFDFRFHFGQLESVVLELADGPAESGALVAVVDGQPEGHLACGHGYDGDVEVEHLIEQIVNIRLVWNGSPSHSIADAVTGKDSIRHGSVSIISCPYLKVVVRYGPTLCVPAWNATGEKEKEVRRVLV